MASPQNGSSKKPRFVRYAVLGLGHIAQAAVLPAFAHARKNSRLATLFSDDPQKRRELGRRYGVPARPYADFEPALRAREFDAVFIALPNSLHKTYAVQSAKAGVHVLCEKPLASRSADAQAMVEAARKYRVRMMTAYRLHFEKANLLAMELVRSGKVGEPRIFNSVFCISVKPGGIRVKAGLGGGSLWDLGVYCVNAARYLFRSEPLEAVAFSAQRPEARFKEVDEMTSAVLRFPGERLAAFTSSFGATDCGFYQVVGTEGILTLDPAYEYREGLALELSRRGRTVLRRTFPVRDQFAPELIYFSDCVLEGKTPEPSVQEGENDVRIIEALYRSARLGRAVSLRDLPKEKHPEPEQGMNFAPVSEVALVHAAPGSE